jgi:hypothetical protein
VPEEAFPQPEVPLDDEMREVVVRKSRPHVEIIAATATIRDRVPGRPLFMPEFGQK